MPGASNQFDLVSKKKILNQLIELEFNDTKIIKDPSFKNKLLEF